MENKRGVSIQDRLSFDIALAVSAKSTEDKKVLAHQALGAAEIAVEFGLITYIEFEKYINSIFEVL